MLLMVLPPFQRLSPVLSRTRLFASLGAERVLNLTVPIVDQQHGATVEAESFESVDDFGQRVDLGEQNWDLVDEETFAIVQERG